MVTPAFAVGLVIGSVLGLGLIRLRRHLARDLNAHRTR